MDLSLYLFLSLDVWRCDCTICVSLGAWDIVVLAVGGFGLGWFLNFIARMMLPIYPVGYYNGRAMGVEIGGCGLCRRSLGCLDSLGLPIALGFALIGRQH